MINELLVKREILGDIAVELYGEFWITEEEFWGSSTERELSEVSEQLTELGWVDPISDEEIEIADMIMEMLIKEGKLKGPRK